MLSTASQYGIRASLFLALYVRRDYVKVREISAALGLSHTFLAKILQKLTADGLLNGRRGPSGGVQLAFEPSEITLMQIVVAIDGQTSVDQCVLGMPGCGTATPCPMHDEWGAVGGSFRELLDTTTLRDLSERLRDGSHSLSTDRSSLASYLAIHPPTS